MPFWYLGALDLASNSPEAWSACRCAIAEALTDEPEMLAAVKELGGSLF